MSNNFREEVHTILKDLEDLLVSKNEKYGNSALEPKRIFSDASPIEQIKVRIDDKLSRMSAGTNDNEDTVQDLMGYLVLLKMAENKTDTKSASIREIIEDKVNTLLDGYVHFFNGFDDMGWIETIDRRDGKVTVHEDFDAVRKWLTDQLTAEQRDRERVLNGRD